MAGFTEPLHLQGLAIVSMVRFDGLLRNMVALGALRRSLYPSSVNSLIKCILSIFFMSVLSIKFNPTILNPVRFIVPAQAFPFTNPLIVTNPTDIFTSIFPPIFITVERLQRLALPAFGASFLHMLLP